VGCDIGFTKKSRQKLHLHSHCNLLFSQFGDTPGLASWI
jgi:hypothetical protein